MSATTWTKQTQPLWYGSAPMSWMLGAAGPSDMLVSGEGCWVVDRTGQRFLDGRAGVGNMALGYSRPDIAEAMHRQALALPFVCTMRYERPAPVIVDHADRLVSIAPERLTRVRFSHTGSSAVESALHMARLYQRILGRPERRTVIALDGSYHGSTLLTMAACGQPMLHQLFGPMPDGFVHVPPPDRVACEACAGDAAASAACFQPVADAVSAIGEDRVAAIIVEPLMGLRGIPLPEHHLGPIRELCTAHDILLIFDEVFTGFGRTGPMFGWELTGVEPDIMCLSKGLTAGYAPLSAILTTDAVYEAFDLPGKPYFHHASSTDAHPVSCAAGLAVLEAFEREGIVERGQRLGERLKARLVSKLDGCPVAGDVRGVGPFIFIDLLGPDGRTAPMETKRLVQHRVEQRGVLIDYTPDVVMLVPPLVMEDAEADHLCDTVAEVLWELKEAEHDVAGLRPPSASGRR